MKKFASILLVAAIWLCRWSPAAAVIRLPLPPPQPAVPAPLPPPPANEGGKRQDRPTSWATWATNPSPTPARPA